jgi:antitoxin component YwqK of YwqJK toxin-antitoxin module
MISQMDIFQYLEPKITQEQLIRGYKEDFLRGYISGGDNDQYLITLKPLGRNNLDRTVVDSRYARYRCERAKIIHIQNKYTGENIKRTHGWHPWKIIYKVGEISGAITDSWPRIGMNFYLSRDPIFLINRPENGVFYKWHLKGSLSMECYYKDNKLHGRCLEWWVDGTRKRVRYYESDLLQGPYKIWYIDGQQAYDCNYSKNRQHGKCIIWHENGQIAFDGNFERGLLEGTQTIYTSTGIKDMENT